MNATCSFQRADLTLCDKPAVRTVQTILGIKPYCTEHGAWVAMVEQEWDDAERDYYEQDL
jgi:hypothetical protein